MLAVISALTRRRAQLPGPLRSARSGTCRRHRPRLTAERSPGSHEEGALPLPLARALLNWPSGSEARYGVFFCAASDGARTQTVLFSWPIDGLGRWRSHHTSRGTQDRPSFEVHGQAEKTQMGMIACQAQIAGSRPAVDALEAREDLLDRGAAPSHGVVEALLPFGQGMMLVGPEHQPRLDAPGSQPGATLMLVIGLVGVDRLLVTADQFVGGHRIVDRSVGQLAATNDRRALVDTDMRLVAEVSLATLLGPSRIRIALAIDQLARRASVRAGRQRVLWRLRRFHGRRDQAGVDQCASAQHQPARVDLAQHLGKQRLVQASLLQSFAEAPDRRVVGRLVAQRKAAEVAERGPVIERFFQFRIGQTVPLLQQHSLEHHQPRIGRRATLRLRQAAQHALDSRPIHQFANPPQDRTPFAPPRRQRICEARLPHLPICHPQILFRCPLENRRFAIYAKPSQAGEGASPHRICRAGSISSGRGPESRLCMWTMKAMAKIGVARFTIGIETKAAMNRPAVKMVATLSRRIALASSGERNRIAASSKYSRPSSQAVARKKTRKPAPAKSTSGSATR